MIKDAQIPRWLELLLGEEFYSACLVHDERDDLRKNFVCLDCCVALCPRCLDPHLSHHLLQIRKYLYKDVVRLEDAEKLIDCSYIQPYSTNRAKVVFIKQRPQARRSRSCGNVCMTCRRCLQDLFFFCSLSCKVTHLLKTEGNVSNNLVECCIFPLSAAVSTELHYGQILSSDSVFALDNFSSGSTNDGLNVMQKKPDGLLTPASSSNSMNRRKKFCSPRRSPMY